jgi:hypothetical protein
VRSLRVDFATARKVPIDPANDFIALSPDEPPHADKEVVGPQVDRCHRLLRKIERL